MLWSPCSPSRQSAEAKSGKSTASPFVSWKNSEKEGPGWAVGSGLVKEEQGRLAGSSRLVSTAAEKAGGQQTHATAQPQVWPGHKHLGCPVSSVTEQDVERGLRG